MVVMAAGKPHPGIPILLGPWWGPTAAFAEAGDGALLQPGWGPFTIWGGGSALLDVSLPQGPHQPFTLRSTPCPTLLFLSGPSSSLLLSSDDPLCPVC